MADAPQHTILYLTGMGRGYDGLRAIGIWLWRRRNVDTQLVPLNWFGDEDFDAKLQRVLVAIDKAAAAGRQVSLVGESAGGSMVLIAATLRPIHRVVLISGTANPGAYVMPYIRHHSPSFVASLAALKKAYPKLNFSKIMTFRALYDHTVYPENTYVAGAHNYRVPTAGHVITVILTVLLLGGWIVRFVRRRI